MKRFLLGLVLAASGAASLPAQVVISEVLYNSPHGGDHEYVEIHNAGTAAADISGWAFTDGISHAFPAGTVIPAGGYLVVAASREKLLAAYPALSPAAVFGDYGGSLANEGERLTLADARGETVERFTYDDDSPWDFLADGFGASLERRCSSMGPGDSVNWRSSRVPSKLEEFGGTPGAGGSETCPPETPARPPLFISEIMYHAVLEEAIDEEYEFIEIHNAGAEAVSLAGWRIAGGVDFAFPAGASIAPGAYLVVAKDRTLLASVASYGLAEGEILGPYERSLDNGGDKVALIGADGQGVDSVSYDDDFPWPSGADALGAGEEWLPRDLLPLESHRHRGHSLERVSFAHSSNEIANWVPSPLDGATPGKPNASARATPLPVVQDLLVRAVEGGGRIIRSGDDVLIQASFTPAPPTGPVEIQFRVDDVMGGSAQPIETLPMFDDGERGGDLVPGDSVFTAMLPKRPDNTIVRYRIHADVGAGLEIISPRSTDPNDWHAYFVSPAIDTTTRVYQLFILPANWGRLYSNTAGGRVSGCNASPTWNATVPAVFVHDGQVFDVFVRHQGSRWNRNNGPAISSFPYPKPPVGLRALSFRIHLPRYKQLEGISDITLNKLTQGCPGYNAGVGYRLFEQAGLPASHTRFVRLHVNGGYYHYMIELERPGEDMMRRYHREMAEANPGMPREKVGHLFKSVGCNCDEGPFGWGDWRLISASCGHSKETRYAHTYDRKTNGWDSPAELIRLVEDLHAARREGNEALRQYFEERFDMDMLLDYMAIINYSVPFDDMFQNHFIYQRVSDGKWILFPWDLDQNFGEWKGANASIYMGEIGNVDNRSGWAHFLKDALLKSFRTEFEERLLLLNNTILHPDNIARLVDEVTAASNPTEAMQAPAGIQCSFPGRATSFKAFAVTRHGIVNTAIAKVKLEAGADQVVFAGSTVQFDARASEPDPSPEVAYVWDNGMEGDFPTAVFSAPGKHVVTLSVTVRGIAFKDTVTITVLPLPELAFEEVGGQVVMEAESFFLNDRHDAANTWWEPDATVAGFSGTNYMEAKQSRRQTFPTRYAGVAPELGYAVLFRTAGVYRVWLHGYSKDTFADSCYVGLDGKERTAGLAQAFVPDPAAFQWSGLTRTQVPQTLTVEEPGLHLFSIWVRDSSQIVDKIILTQDIETVPTGLGPPESGRAPVGPTGSFVRGDADGSSTLSVNDALAILLHLFRGGPALDCQDHGDTDDNGSLDVTDAVVILDFLFRRGTAPAAPFPNAGFDPTPDGEDCGDG
jgi:hypothetical protein